MTPENIKERVKEIVAEAKLLSKKYTDQESAPVNYACIFTQRGEEFEELVALTGEMGYVIDQTSMGPIFKIEPLETASGTLNLLKIRRPDPDKPEKGYADFTVSDYQAFKREYLSKPGFHLLARPKMEIIGLADDAYNVRAYYANPTLPRVLGLDK